MSPLRQAAPQASLSQIWHARFRSTVRGWCVAQALQRWPTPKSSGLRGCGWTDGIKSAFARSSTRSRGAASRAMHSNTSRADARSKARWPKWSSDDDDWRPVVVASMSSSVSVASSSSMSSSPVGRRRRPSKEERESSVVVVDPTRLLSVVRETSLKSRRPGLLVATSMTWFRARDETAVVEAEILRALRAIVATPARPTSLRVFLTLTRSAVVSRLTSSKFDPRPTLRHPLAIAASATATPTRVPRSIVSRRSTTASRGYSSNAASNSRIPAGLIAVSSSSSSWPFSSSSFSSFSSAAAAARSRSSSFGTTSMAQRSPRAMAMSSWALGGRQTETSKARAWWLRSTSARDALKDFRARRRARARSTQPPVSRRGWGPFRWFARIMRRGVRSSTRTTSPRWRNPTW
mmetsp:Transcript_5230/g.17139  ORF Transcript_5230/g.17139 Transcript_5230/m.17139 type:complete len:406 (+) Transcript_5230:328-1545(+)